MVTIRLARGGSKKRPFYSILVADQRRAPRGRFIERVGFFDPVASGGAERLRIDLERVTHWVNNGAKPSERVAQLCKQARINAETAQKARSKKAAAKQANTKKSNPKQSAKQKTAKRQAAQSAAQPKPKTDTKQPTKNLSPSGPQSAETTPAENPTEPADPNTNADSATPKA